MKLKLLVVGRGRVGRSLARAWRRSGHSVSLAAHDAKRFAKCEVCLIAVPDRAIAEVVAHLAPRLASRALVVHTAGALGLKPLASARELGHRIGALHPLLAIAS